MYSYGARTVTLQAAGAGTAGRRGVKWCIHNHYETVTSVAAGGGRQTSWENRKRSWERVRLDFGKGNCGGEGKEERYVNLTDLRCLSEAGAQLFIPQRPQHMHIAITPLLEK